MTKRLKVYLLILFAAASLTCALVGCKVGGPGREELLAGYDSHITYYSNGGSFNGSVNTTVMEIYYKAGNDGVPFFNVTNDTFKYGLKVEREGYDLKGWYEPVRYTEADGEKYAAYVGEIKYVITYVPDANGNIPEEADDGLGNSVTESVFPLKNSKGGYITDSNNDRPLFARMNEDGALKDEQISEARVTVVADEEKLIAGYDEEAKEVNNLTIKRNDVLDACAVWERSASVRYNLIVTDEDGNVLADKEGEDPTYYNVTKLDANGEEQVVSKYKNEDPIDMISIHGKKVTPMDREPLKLSGLTFVRTYMDKELTEKVHSVERPEKNEEGEAVIDVYCRYVKGDWTVVTAKKSTELTDTYESRIRSMFEGLYNKDNKYLIIDDIDGSDFKSVINLKRSDMSMGASNATIVVNGNTPLTMSNLKFGAGDKGQIAILRNKDYSIFGAIGENFKVKGAGLIIKNSTVTLASTTNPYYFYAICASANPAASANLNLTIDTVTVKYTLGDDAKINGFTNAEDLAGRWMFGGAASDEAFLEAFTGIKLADGDNSTISEQPEQYD